MTIEQIDALNIELAKHTSLFRESYGFRSKVGIDGQVSKFQTLKYFDMPKELRSLIDSANLSPALETYILRFPVDGFLCENSCIETCFLECDAILLSNTETEVIIDGQSTTLANQGDSITIPLKSKHCVPKVTEQTDFLVTLKTKIHMEGK